MGLYHVLSVKDINIPLYDLIQLFQTEIFR